MGSLFKICISDKGFLYGTLTIQPYEDSKTNGKTFEQMCTTKDVQMTNGYMKKNAQNYDVSWKCRLRAPWTHYYTLMRTSKNQQNRQR